MIIVRHILIVIRNLFFSSSITSFQRSVVPERDRYREETANGLALVRGGLPKGHLLEDTDHFFVAGGEERYLDRDLSDTPVLLHHKLGEHRAGDAFVAGILRILYRSRKVSVQGVWTAGELGKHISKRHQIFIILISANTPFSLRRVPQGRADVPSVDEEHGCAASGSEFC